MLAGLLDSISIGLLVPLLATFQQESESAQSGPAALELFRETFRSISVEPTLGPLVIAVLLAIAGKNLLQVAAFGTSFYLTARVSAELRSRAANLLMNVGLAFHDQAQVSDLSDIWYNKTRGVGQLIRTVITFGADAVTALFLFGLLFLLSWKLTLVALLLSLLCGLALRVYTRRVHASGRQLILHERNLLSAISENLNAIRLIRTTGTAPRVLDTLNERIDKRAHHEFLGHFMVYSMSPVADLLGSIAIAGLALLGLAILNLGSGMALSLLLPFLYVLLRLVPLARVLARERAKIAHLWPNIGEIRKLLTTEDKPFLVDGDREFPGLSRDIRFCNVDFRYPGRPEPVLSGIDVTIMARQTTAIIGETGSGKSTLVHLLLRLHDPDSGRIEIDGVPINEFRIASLHKRMGLVSQETVLFNDTIWANLAFAAHDEPTQDQIEDAARKAGIHEFIRALPDGYETVVGDRGVRLSGGQKQRLAIARMFIRQPEILLLDEATSSLDNQTERWVQRSITELSQGKTVIIVAHRLSTIQNADHVIVLKNGRVAESGTLEALRRGDSEYARLAAEGG